MDPRHSLSVILGHKMKTENFTFLTFYLFLPVRLLGRPRVDLGRVAREHTEGWRACLLLPPSSARLHRSLWLASSASAGDRRPLKGAGGRFEGLLSGLPRPWCSKLILSIYSRPVSRKPENVRGSGLLTHSSPGRLSRPRHCAETAGPSLLP